MYFMQHTRELEVIPATMGEVAAIRQAFEVANQANLNRDELEELEHQSIFIQDQRNAIALANRQGREEGREEGAVSMQRSIAMNLLATMDDAAIANLTGLTMEDVAALR
jgi:predicted transposase/invertase (TIGR01784 family)